MKDVKEQKQNDNGEIIEMKQGQVIKIPKNSGKAWLTLFYSLPQEFVSKRPVYLNFPRCPYEVLRTDKYDSMINNDTFLELVWDCVAWSAWQYFEVPYQKGGYREIPGSAAQYSGDFPLWRLSYSMLPLLRDKFEVSGFSFQQLYNVPEGTELPWLTYQQFGNLIGTLVPEIIQEQNWQPMIDEIWNNRTIEDFDKRGSQVKLDFMRSWEHSRSRKKAVSIEQLAEDAEENIDESDAQDELLEANARGRMAEKNESVEKNNDELMISDKEDTTMQEEATVPPTLSSEEVMAEAMRSFTFDESNKMAWPVLGHITLDYSMDETVLFKSLGVYKCSPGIIINSEVGTNVAAAASGVVTDVAELSETGTTVTVSIGNGYETTTGMIENVNLKKGDKVTTGQLIGTVASPSAYYIEEGPGVYFKLTQYGEPINPDTYFVE